MCAIGGGGGGVTESWRCENVRDTVCVCVCACVCVK